MREVKRKVAAVDARLESVEREAQEISADQQRLRDNIKALEKAPDARQLIVRYVGKANEQETRMEQLTNERKTARQERDRLQAELDQVFRELEPKL